MTCIVAIVHENEVFMAGDLMGSNGFTKKVYPDSKVFKNGDFVIGYTDSFRMGQLLQYNWEQPPRIEGLSDRQYLQVDVIESIRATFNAYGYGDKSGIEDIGGNFLIGYKGVIYEMQPNFSILQHSDFAAVGSGQYHAEASLAILYDSIKSSEDVLSCLGDAIKTAARFTTSVSGEYTWETTYVPSEQEVEDMLWEANSIMVDEALDALDISEEEKQIFSKVSVLLDNSMVDSHEEVDTSTPAKSNENNTNFLSELKVVPVYDAEGEKVGEASYYLLNGTMIDVEYHHIKDSVCAVVDSVFDLNNIISMNNSRNILLEITQQLTGKKYTNLSTDKLIIKFRNLIIECIEAHISGVFSK